MKKFLIAVGLTAMAIAPAHAVTLYGVDTANQLISFDSRTPGIVKSSVAIQGLGNAIIRGLDFRTADGSLYALTSDNRLISINYNTGASRLRANVAVTGTRFAFDFNPTNTNLRIVSQDTSNYVFNFAQNSLITGVNVAYPANVAPLGPNIVGAAYTFNDNNPATGTTLYVVDSRNDLLAIQNPATGVLTRVGGIRADVSASLSFDIATRGSSNAAFLYDELTLRSVDLATGISTRIGNTDRALVGLTASIPEPSTWAMMIIGFGAVGAAARSSRRQRKTVTA
jgi:Domain of unknown function (DUF4394)/PEP-CTERM motif